MVLAVLPLLVSIGIAAALISNPALVNMTQSANAHEASLDAIAATSAEVGALSPIINHPFNLPFTGVAGLVACHPPCCEAHTEEWPPGPLADDAALHPKTKAKYTSFDEASGRRMTHQSFVTRTNAAGMGGSCANATLSDGTVFPHLEQCEGQSRCDPSSKRAACRDERDEARVATSAHDASPWPRASGLVTDRCWGPSTFAR